MISHSAFCHRCGHAGTTWAASIAQLITAAAVVIGAVLNYVRRRSLGHGFEIGICHDMMMLLSSTFLGSSAAPAVILVGLVPKDSVLSEQSLKIQISDAYFEVPRPTKSHMAPLSWSEL